jgi:hypothetical protein
MFPREVPKNVLNLPSPQRRNDFTILVYQVDQIDARDIVNLL